MGDTQQQAGAATPLQPWDRQPGEPTKWYGRFLVYLELGPARTLTEAFALVNKQEDKPAHCPNGRWTLAQRQWQWRARAQAWDIEQRDLLALSERNRRLAMREQRVAITEENLEVVRGVLRNMHLLEADEHEARKWLLEMRGFLRDMLWAQRLEFERVAYDKDEADDELRITADDLRAAQRALEAQQAGAQLAGGQLTGAQHAGARQEISILPEAWVGPCVRPSERAQVRTLLVCIGPDARQQMDLAALRAVRAATGLRFSRLVDTTQRKFAACLRRERGLGHPVELLHLALPVAAEGIQFTDGWADGNWLSELLQGVQVLLLVGCAGENAGAQLGDWLGVVPHVVSVGEEIGAEDAAVLTQHFWHAICAGKEPGVALEEALGYCPPAVAEYVVRHW